MTTKHDLESAVRGWVAMGSERLPDAALDAALQEIAITPQRGRLPVRRFPITEGNVLRIGVAAAALLAAVFIGWRFLPGVVGGPGPVFTPTPTPAPTTIASGSFTVPEFGSEVEIEATGSASNVSGRMDVSGTGGQFSVDLQCTKTTEGGLLLIGGNITESTYDDAPVDTRAAIVFQPGTPVRAIFWFQNQPDPFCAAFLDAVQGDITEFLQPIEGDVELRP